MVEASDVGMVIHASSIPFFNEAEEYAKMGLIPGGAHRNKKFRAQQIEMDPALSAEMIDILFDPQTSGGLLISLTSERAEELLSHLENSGIEEEAAVIGEVTSEPRGKIVVKSI